MIDKVKYWVELSDYDLITASVMLNGARYLYVGFMCHQTIEKILKAYLSLDNSIKIPHTHNLAQLASMSNLYGLLNDDFKNTIDILEPLNIESRYPSYKEKLMKSMNKEFSLKLIEITRELQEWIKSKL